MRVFKFKSVLIVSAVAIVLAVAALVFSFQMQSKAKEQFSANGYVMSVDTNKVKEATSGKKGEAVAAEASEGSSAPQASVHEFASQTAYRVKYPHKVVFDDSKGERVSVDEKSFVHYSDNSLSSFSKGVFVDLNNVDADLICYYDLPKNKTLSFSGEAYTYENSSAPLSITDLLWKIADDKYLVASSDIQFTSGNEVVHRFQGPGSYLEVSYVDSGVVVFVNNEGVYQTVAEDSTVTLANGVTIDFGKKLITSTDGTSISLAQMVIGADDNVELAAKEGEQAIVDANSPEGSETPAAAGTAAGTASGSAVSGAAGSAGSASGSSSDDSGEVVEEPDNSKALPVFNLAGGSTSPVGFKATVNITDDANLLSSGSKVTIIETETGKVVYEGNIAAGVLNFDISTANLKPHTEYVMSVEASYSDGNHEYTKTFLDKVFTTDAVGISFDKDYLTSNSIAIVTRIGSYSNVVASNIRLFDAKGNIVETKAIDPGLARSDDGFSVLFNNLAPNASYSVELCDVTYSDLTVDSFGDAVSYTTLKREPKFKLPTVVTDRKESAFTFSLDGTEDLDAGITGYTWEIYRADQVIVDQNGETTISGDPVRTISPTFGTNPTVAVDNKTIMSATKYVTRVVAQFNDNEKMVEYITPFCASPFSIEGISYPSMRFEVEKDENGNPILTFESIKAMIYIDSAYAVQADASNPLVITWTNSLGVTKQETVTNLGPYLKNGTISLPFDHNDLRANDVYTVSVYATIDLHDENPPSRAYIGSAQFNTPSPSKIAVKFSSGVVARDSFSVDVALKAAETTAPIDLEMHTMSQLTLQLFEGVDTSAAPIAKLLIPGGTTINDPYSSALYEKIYENAMTVTPSTFGMGSNDLKANTYYTIMVGPATDYTSWPNQMVFDETTISFAVKTSNTYPDLPNDRTTGVAATAIKNIQATSYGGTYDPTLADATIVGYRLQASFPNANKIARTLYYHVRDARTNTILHTFQLQIKADGVVPAQTFFFKDEPTLTRGRDYLFTYEMLVNLTGDPAQDIMYPECAEPGAVLSSKTCLTPLQAATVALIPKTSAATSVTWTYKVSDPDNALKTADSKFQSRPRATTAYSDLSVDTTAGWHDMTVTTASAQVYTVNMLQNLYPKYIGTSSKQTSDIQTTKMLENYFEAPVTLKASAFTITAAPDVSTNQLKVLLTGDSSIATTALDNVAAVKLTLKSVDDQITYTITKDATVNLEFRTLELSVSLSDIKNLLRKEFRVEAQLVYDSGTYGFATMDGGEFAIQRLDATAANSTYLRMNNSNWTPSATASSSYYSTTTAFNPDTLTAVAYKNLITNASGTLKLAATQNGMMALDANGAQTGTYVTLKKAVTTTDSTARTDTILFDTITPIVGITSTVSEIDRGIVKLHVSGTENVEIQNSSIVVALYEVTPGGNTLVGTYAYPVGAIGSDFTITLPSDVDANHLKSDTQYLFTVSVNLRPVGSTGTYTLRQLNDEKTGSPRTYSFTTARDVTIAIKSVDYSAKKYNEKTLDLTYSLNRSIGFDIEYLVYKCDSSGVVTDPTPIGVTWPQTLYNFDNTVSMSCNPGELTAKMPLGNYYKVMLKAWPKDSSRAGTPLGTSEYVFRLEKLKNPLTSIVATPQVKTYQKEGQDATYNTLEYRASVLDTDGTVVNDSYRVRFFKLASDGTKTQIATAYDDSVYKTTDYNKLFTFGTQEDPLEPSTRYVLEVYGVKDTLNVGGKDDISSYHGSELDDPDLLISSATASTVNESGVDLGIVKVMPSGTSGDKLQLEYYNSVNITSIDTVTYTIYNGNGVVASKTEPFHLTVKSYGEGQYYVFTPNATLPSAGFYYIQVQYKKTVPGADDPAIIASDVYTYSYAGETPNSPLARLLSMFTEGNK